MKVDVYSPEASVLWWSDWVGMVLLLPGLGLINNTEEVKYFVLGDGRPHVQMDEAMVALKHGAGKLIRGRVYRDEEEGGVLKIDPDGETSDDKDWREWYEEQVKLGMPSIPIVLTVRGDPIAITDEDANRFTLSRGTHTVSLRRFLIIETCP